MLHPDGITKFFFAWFHPVLFGGENHKSIASIWGLFEGPTQRWILWHFICGLKLGIAVFIFLPLESFDHHRPVLVVIRHEKCRSSFDSFGKVFTGFQFEVGTSCLHGIVKRQASTFDWEGRHSPSKIIHFDLLSKKGRQKVIPDDNDD